MKKVTFLAIAFAAMAFAMTSCNKEENTPGMLQGTLEDNAILNEAKDHINNDAIVFDRDDLAVFVNGFGANAGAANYRANSASDNPTWRYVSKYNANGADFDASAALRFYYPQTSTWADSRKVKIMNTRSCRSGEFGSMPMYGEGTNGDIVYRNLLGGVKFNVTSDRPITKIVVTSNANYLSGVFAISNAATDPVLTIQNNAGSGTWAKGKTVTVNMTAPVANPTLKPHYVFLPPKTYAANDLTFKFYSGDAYCTMSPNVDFTVSRTQYVTVPADLTSRTWSDQAQVL